MPYACNYPVKLKPWRYEFHYAYFSDYVCLFFFVKETSFPVNKFRSNRWCFHLRGNSHKTIKNSWILQKNSERRFFKKKNEFNLNAISSAIQHLKHFLRCQSIFHNHFTHMLMFIFTPKSWKWFVYDMLGDSTTFFPKICFFVGHLSW